MTASAILIQFLNGLAGASSLFLVAAGLSIIFGVTRIINFAHGSFFMLGLYLAYSLIERFGHSAAGFWSGVVVASVAVALLGALGEGLLLRRIYAAPEMLELLATFALVLVIQDFTLWAWGPEDLLGPRAPGLGGAVEIAGQDRGQPRRQLERRRVAHLERGGVVHPPGLRADRLDDLAPPMTGIDAPHAGDAVHHLPAVIGGVVQPFGGDEQPRRPLALAVGGDRLPVGSQIVDGVLRAVRHGKS